MIFNRPVLTRQAFAEIRRAQPAKLLVVADGPRFPEEEGTCAVARAIVEHGVDWDCEVLFNCCDTNLGCKRAHSTVGGGGKGEQVIESSIDPIQA